MVEEFVKFWINELLEKHRATKIEDLPSNVLEAEIADARETIKNEHVWELGYDGEEPVNPHTENMEALREYIETLEETLGRKGSLENLIGDAEAVKQAPENSLCSREMERE